MHWWREHFERVLNHEEQSNPPQIEPSDELNIRIGCITRVEIKNAMKKLKSGKAAGCDNIPPEAIKVGDDMSEEVLLDLFNWIWNEQQTPEECEVRYANQAAKEGRFELL